MQYLEGGWKLPPFTEMTYPELGSNVLESTADRILRALEARHWQVPGIHVEFYDYGKGELRFRRVARIAQDSGQYQLFFDSVSGTRSEIESQSAQAHQLCSVYTPNSSLAQFPDKTWRHGPSAGGLWGKNSSLFDDREFRHPGSGKLAGICARINQEIEGALLRPIEQHPIVEGPVPTETDHPQVPRNLGPIHMLVSEDEFFRIWNGWADHPHEDPSQRYAISCFGPNRLLSLYARSGEHTPIQAFDAHYWGAFDSATGAESLAKTKLFEGLGNGVQGKARVIEVKPKHAGGLFVIDMEAALREEMPEYLSAGACRRAIAESMTPLENYRGNFGRAALVIARELAMDEVDLNCRR